jgi:8-oxo-dGTP diphosphatase
MSRIEVAVGIVYNQKGQLLVCKRLLHQYQGGYWEFPGGKVEPGETVAQALARELQEEVGINVLQQQPWMTVDYDYHQRAVRLNVVKVTVYENEPKGCEGQEIQWREVDDLPLLEWVPANQTIVHALQAKT